MTEDEIHVVHLHGGTVMTAAAVPGPVVLRQLRIWTRDVADLGPRRALDPTVLTGAAETLGEFIAAGLIGNGAYAAFPDAVAYLRARLSPERGADIDSAEDLDNVIRSAARALLGRRPKHLQIREAVLDGDAWQVRCTVEADEFALIVSRRGEITLWSPTTT